MRRFWKDYIELCKEDLRFLKKHWIGYITISIIGGIGTWLYLGGYDQVKERIEEKKSE